MKSNSILSQRIWERVFPSRTLKETLRGWIALSRLKMYLNDQFLYHSKILGTWWILVCIQWWKHYFYVIHHKLLNYEDKYVQMRRKNIFKNSIFLTCSNSKSKAKIASKVFTSNNWRNKTKPKNLECSSITRSLASQWFVRTIFVIVRTNF